MLVVREAFGQRPRLSLLSSNKSSTQKIFPQGQTTAAIHATNVAPAIGELTMALRKKRATRRGWSRKDLGDLKSLAKKKTPARMIGRHLKRSEGAVRQKAYAVGVSLSLRKRRRRKRAK
jgi:hypothetical protein